MNVCLWVVYMCSTCGCVRVCVCECTSACICMYVCILGQSQCCESTPFPPTLPIGVVERLSCVERKVDDLQHSQDSQSAAIQDLQRGQVSQTTAIQDLQSEQDLQSTAIHGLRHEQDSLSQRMQEVETQFQGV